MASNAFSQWKNCFLLIMVYSCILYLILSPQVGASTASGSTEGSSSDIYVDEVAEKLGEDAALVIHHRAGTMPRSPDRQHQTVLTSLPQDLTEKNPTTNEKNTKGSEQSEVKKAENESTHKTIKEKHENSKAQPFQTLPRVEENLTRHGGTTNPIKHDNSKVDEKKDKKDSESPSLFSYFSPMNKMAEAFFCTFSQDHCEEARNHSNPSKTNKRE